MPDSYSMDVSAATSADMLRLSRQNGELQCRITGLEELATLQKQRIDALATLSKDALELLPIQGKAYGHSVSNPDWRKEAAARKAWRERALALLGEN